MARLELRGVGKVYPNGTRALEGIDLAIEDGRMLVVVGPSGCGKSTLLRMVAGLEECTEGEIDLEGRVVNGLEPVQRDMAMVFQNYALYPHMSVRENISYSLRNRKVPADEIERRVGETARTLHIEELLDRKPRQLSGGQRQRVAMGRAIIREPKMFLFDEPLSNLDAKLRTRMRLEIKRLQRRLGVTSMYVTHDQVEALTLGDTLALLRDGRVEQAGTPEQLYARPATTFAAEFIGSPAMNLLPVTRTGGGIALEDGTELAVDAQAEAGARLLLGLRPQDGLHEDQAAPGGLAVTMTVVDTESLGSDVIVHGTVGGTKDFAFVSGAGKDYGEGDRINLAYAHGSVHLFDEGTGRRLANV